MKNKKEGRGLRPSFFINIYCDIFVFYKLIEQSCCGFFNANWANFREKIRVIRIFREIRVKIFCSV